MEIIVLGTGCANCKTTYDKVAKVIADTNSTATLKKEEDIWSAATNKRMKKRVTRIASFRRVLKKKISQGKVER